MILKTFYWSLKDKTGRFNYLNGILRLIPGELGIQLRSRLLPKYFKSCGSNILIHENVKFMNIHKISIGDNVALASGCFLQGAGEILIGNNVLFGPDVKIWSANHVIKDTEKTILSQGWEYKKVIIEDGVWLAANVFVLPGVTIPEGCVIGAGSVVNVKKYPPYSIISGNPARVIGNRKSLSSTKEE